MTLKGWTNKQICKYFGHKWGDWEHFIYFPTQDDDEIRWPKKSCKCARCGKVHEVDDLQNTVNCRCYQHPGDPS